MRSRLGLPWLVAAGAGVASPHHPQFERGPERSRSFKTHSVFKVQEDIESSSAADDFTDSSLTKPVFLIHHHVHYAFLKGENRNEAHSFFKLCNCPGHRKVASSGIFKACGIQNSIG
jgi:hypothetical protein